ncbi:MAG: GntR family transcriptional regulator [Rhodospirillaceae bacterium]|jgi:DNA-binding GntR family transcriptional regulator|nr:GntR family transcriptional regulator [Rhodospirillaceae bacterium]MBT7267496.1 GntR family transcriptional regulator [Rhodospirillaceae bacterium]
MNSFNPVENITLTDRIYRELSRAVIMGEFRPGDTLTIRELASMYGTSAQPVREAVNRLAAGRALTIIANRSIKVPELSLDSVKNLSSTRTLIEGEAAAQAALIANDDEKFEIETFNRELMDSFRERNINQIIRANYDFHFAIYRVAHNEILFCIIESLWLQSGPSAAFLYSSDNWASDRMETSTIEYHNQILAAIKSQDSEGARQAITSDIESAAAVYADAIASANEDNAEVLK